MKKRVIFSYLLILGILAVSAPAYGRTEGREVRDERAERTFSLPASSRQVSDNVFYLGERRDPGTGQLVEGYAIVHRRDVQARSFSRRPPKTIQCYGFFAKGAIWKTIEPWLVNADNASGLSDSFVLSRMSGDISKWENAGSADILGVGSLTTAILSTDTSAPDNQNEVYFASITEPGAIAVTTVWGYFRGPTAWRELVEWDMVFDDADYDWSSSGEAGKMDLENISTHELGHSVGMIDLYDDTCSQETMYGYADSGETQKRDLNTGDITGISELY